MKDDEHPTLPGMDRSKRVKPEDAYDDTARGHVGAPHAKTEESRDAAIKVLPKAGAQRCRVWEYIDEQGDEGATPDEVSAALSIPVTSAGPRCYELRALGRIIKTANRRKTRAGGTSRVHLAVQPDDWTDKRKDWPSPATPNALQRMRGRIKELEVAAELASAEVAPAAARVPSLGAFPGTRLTCRGFPSRGGGATQHESSPWLGRPPKGGGPRPRNLRRCRTACSRSASGSASSACRCWRRWPSRPTSLRAPWAASPPGEPACSAR